MKSIPDEVLGRLATNRAIYVGERHFLREHINNAASDSPLQDESNYAAIDDHISTQMSELGISGMALGIIEGPDNQTSTGVRYVGA